MHKTIKKEDHDKKQGYTFYEQIMYSNTSRGHVHLAHVRFYDKLVIQIIFCTLSQTREVIQNKIRRILRNF